MKDECINCGAWKGLHHYETNQCPHNGQEASLGKLQEWDNTVYQEDNTAELRAKIAEQAATIARLTENLENANIATTSLQIQNGKLIGENSRLTAAHEMQGESLVVLPRWMVSNMEDKLKAQAEEIQRLKNEIIRFSDLSHNIVSYMAAYNSPEREKESNERIDVQLNAILKVAGEK